MPETTPINKVLQLRTQGLSNAQIIEELEKENYTPNQIFDAMNQADMKASVTNAPTPQPFTAQNPMNPQQPQAFQQQPQMQQQIPQSTQPPLNVAPEDMSAAANPSGEVLDVETEKIEEVAEAIIDEKWQDFVDTINKVIEWKEKTEQKIIQVESQIKDLKDQFTQLQKGTLDKMAEYDEHILDIGTEIKAMESVFKKILPTFTENITELSRIVNELKKE